MKGIAWLFVSSLIVAIGLWGVFGFMAWNWNVASWGQGGREFAAFFWACWVLAEWSRRGKAKCSRCV